MPRTGTWRESSGSLRAVAKHQTPSGAELNAKRVAAADLANDQHLHICEICGQQVDRRRLGDILHHEQSGHHPLPLERQHQTPKFIPPMMPCLVDEPPERPGWTHEIKHDGYRTQLHVAGENSRAFSRNGHNWSERYRKLLDRAAQLPCDSAILDGEVILQDERGRSDFHSLRSVIAREPERLVFMAFDLLELDGHDLRRKPLERRRELLGSW